MFERLWLFGRVQEEVKEMKGEVWVEDKDRREGWSGQWLQRVQVLAHFI